jgi:hypothetical protein
MTISGNAGLGSSGIIYAPAAQVNFSGNSILSVGVIANLLSFSDNSSTSVIQVGAFQGAPGSRDWLQSLNTLWDSFQGAANDQARSNAAVGVLNQVFGQQNTLLSKVDANAQADIHIQAAAIGNIDGFTASNADKDVASGWFWNPRTRIREIGEYLHVLVRRLRQVIRLR